MFFNSFLKGFLIAALLSLSAAPAVSAAQFGLQTQAEQEGVLKEVGVDEKPGARVPAGLIFTDQFGKSMRLSDYIAGKPVLLSLNYYMCPMLCPVTFANLTRTIREMKGLEPGKDYKVAVISINPEETPKLAREKADETYSMLAGYPDPSRWWPFLLGKEIDIKAVASAVGYRYKKTDEVNYAHPSVLIVLTPEGRVSRYLYGLEHDPKDLRLALLEASRGEVGASPLLNRIMLSCYHYDPVGKKYVLAAANIMKGVAGLVAISLAALFFFLWRAGRAGKRA